MLIFDNRGKCLWLFFGYSALNLKMKLRKSFLKFYFCEFKWGDFFVDYEKFIKVLLVPYPFLLAMQNGNSSL